MAHEKVEKTVKPSKETTKGVKRLKVAQSLGKTVRALETQAHIIRTSIEELDLAPLYPPEGQKFRVFKDNARGDDKPLRVEPFNHRIAEWDEPYSRGSAEYAAIVGDDDKVLVDVLEYDAASLGIWGYVLSRRVRVLVDHPSVNVDIVEVGEATV